jgi:hypothetical protein
MTPDRLDDLLQRALESGTIPDDAAPAERPELERLLAARADIAAVRAGIDAEAANALPAARARFQRYLAAQRPAPVEVRAVASRPGRFERLFGGRRLSLAGSLAAVLIVAAVALFVSRPFQGAQQVQALGVDDYVQLTGTVAAADASGITIETAEFGRVAVAASGATFLDAAGAVMDRPPRPGEAVSVAGFVRDARQGRLAIDGQTVALAAALPGGDGRPLERLAAPAQGTVTLVAIDRDGKEGRAVILLPDGRRALVDVDVDSLGQLLAATGSPLGSKVTVDQPGGRLLEMRLDMRPGSHDGDGDGDGHHRDGPPLVRLTGTLQDVTPTGFTLQTADGPVQVVRRPRLKFLPGESGLSMADIRAGASFEGYSATVAGGFDPRTGAFIAELVVLGPKP